MTPCSSLIVSNILRRHGVTGEVRAAATRDIFAQVAEWIEAYQANEFEVGRAAGYVAGRNEVAIKTEIARNSGYHLGFIDGMEAARKSRRIFGRRQ